MGGHSSGDVFATGADMTETEKTNNISIDQVAAKAIELWLSDQKVFSFVKNKSR